MTGGNDSLLFFASVCGSDNPFWDPELSWHSSNPDLSICFLKTVPIWLPSAVLWLATFLVCVFAPRRRRKDKSNWSGTKEAEVSLPRSFGEEFRQFTLKWRHWSPLFAVKVATLLLLILVTVTGSLKSWS